MNQVGHVDRITVGLTSDVEQHCGLTVSRHRCMERLYTSFDQCHVADLDRNAGWRRLDDDLSELLRVRHLAAHQRQVNLMVLVQESRRVDEICTPD